MWDCYENLWLQVYDAENRKFITLIDADAKLSQEKRNSVLQCHCTEPIHPTKQSKPF